MAKARPAHQPLAPPPHPLTPGFIPLRPQEPPSRPGAPHPWDHTMDEQRGPFLELREDGDPPSSQIRLSLGPCLRKVVGEKLPAALTWTGSCSPGVGGFWSGP